MAYHQNFLRLVVIGQLYGIEDFSFGLTLIGPNGAAPVAPSVVPPAVITATQAMWQAAPALICSNAHLLRIKLNEIGTDGKYVNDDTVEHEYPSFVPGTAGSTPAPQIAYAVSLQTPKARGRAHAGRFYLPLPALEPGSAGTVQASDVSSANATVTTWLKAINAALGAWQIGVVSNLGVGAQELVTNARFGRVLDTIRSRRDKFTEDYALGPAIIGSNDPDAFTTRSH